MLLSRRLRAALHLFQALNIKTIMVHYEGKVGIRLA